MKKYFCFVCVFCCLVFLMDAQVQKIWMTTEQLTELEKILDEYRESRKILKQQQEKLQKALELSQQELTRSLKVLVQLQKELAVQQNTVEKLRTQLQQQKTLTDDLSNYYSNCIIRQKKLIQEIQDKNLKLARSRRKFLLISGVEFLIIILVIIFTCVDFFRR